MSLTDEQKRQADAEISAFTGGAGSNALALRWLSPLPPLVVEALAVFGRIRGLPKMDHATETPGSADVRVFAGRDQALYLLWPDGSWAAVGVTCSEDWAGLDDSPIYWVPEVYSDGKVNPGATVDHLRAIDTAPDHAWAFLRAAGLLTDAHRRAVQDYWGSVRSLAREAVAWTERSNEIQRARATLAKYGEE